MIMKETLLIKTNTEPTQGYGSPVVEEPSTSHINIHSNKTTHPKIYFEGGVARYRFNK